MVLDMLDLSQPDKFLDYNTASTRAAEAENESIMQSIAAELNDPKEYEDHLIHWRIHMKQMREWSFKNQTPIEIQDQMQDHVLAHELLIMEKGKANPLYLEKAMTELAGFPVFFELPQPPAPATVLPEEVAAAGAQAGTMELPPELPVNMPPLSVVDQVAAESAMPDATGPIEPSTAI
jgi:hypothetical protein